MERIHFPPHFHKRFGDGGGDVSVCPILGVAEGGEGGENISHADHAVFLDRRGVGGVDGF